MTSLHKYTISVLAEKIKNGNRRSLAQAITLIESTVNKHREQSKTLLKKLSGSSTASLKIGLTGTPGVGKSTFIESLGLHLIQCGKKIAVLTIDPTSSTSGGSILGDKTRMELLSRDPNVFIRPSPNSGSLGGVGRRTRDAITLCEAAGFDIILIETVGVGQSETMVSEMTDIFCLLIAPAGGDELQGVKRGIIEMSDIILINKADGKLESIAKTTCSEYKNALSLFRKRKYDPPQFPKVMTISAIKGFGLEQAWAEIEILITWRKQHGFFSKIRDEQQLMSFKRELENHFQNQLMQSEFIIKERHLLENKIRRKEISANSAAELLISKIFN